MIQVVLLDAGPLGLATNPKATDESDECKAELSRWSDRGVVLVVPGIADYEVRRELLRAGKRRGLRQLDLFVDRNRLLHVTPAALRMAAEFWADARKRGIKTADDKALDADVILAAQAAGLGLEATDYVIATSNPAHIARFVPAKRWQDIEIGED